jgi:hypothetical protein
MNLVRSVLAWVTGKGIFGAPRIIHSRDAKRVYLYRWYITDAPTCKDGSEPFDETGQPRPGIVWSDKPFSVLLHRFASSDDGDALHNHPWTWAFSIILAGGYEEERKVSWGNVVARKVVRPFSVNRIGQDDFHRVDLIEEDCWTLFVTGPKISSWSFWDRVTGEVVHWRTWIDRFRSEVFA